MEKGCQHYLFWQGLRITVSIFGKSKGHFLAEISVYPCGPETHRRNKPAFNGIRWDFVYDEDHERDQERAMCYMIWPEFLDESGVAISSKIPLVGTYRARMHIVSSEMVEENFEKLRVGTKFYCSEGTMITAKGTVTKLTV